MNFEVGIIGAGPAGSAAAITLARAGASVALFERGSFPRDKVCGEFLSPEVARLVDGLGCADEFRRAQPARITRARLVPRSGQHFEFELPAPAWGLSRRRFDALLAEAAVAAGARLFERAEVCRIEENTGSVETRDGRSFQARRVLLAAGRHSILDPLPSTTREYFGFKAHFQGPCEPCVELYFFDGGYCGVSPVEDGLVNVCALVERRLLGPGGAERVIAGIPALHRRLAELRRVMPFLYTGPVALGWRAHDSSHAAAGDAAMFIDPFTGDGMSLALESGAVAAQHHLAGGCSADLAALLRARFARRLRAARWLRRAAFAGWLQPPLAALLRMPFVHRGLFDWAFRATRDGACSAPVTQ